MSDLPPGFVLDGAAPAAPPPNMGLPDGFVLDQSRSVTDKLTGQGGERYQTWPERLLRGIGASVGSGVTLPGDVYAGRAQIPSSGAVPGSVPFGDANSSGERVADLAMVANPINPAVRAGDLAFPGVNRAIAPQAVAPPTREAVLDSAKSGFQSSEVKNLAIDAGAIKDLSGTIQAELEQKGIDENLAPKTFGILRKLQTAPDGAIATGDNLASMRRIFGNAAGSPDKTERLAARNAQGSVDDFVRSGVPEEAVLSGDRAAAGARWDLARGDYAAASRSQVISDAIEKAQRQAGSANSGTNFDNALRQQFKSLLNSPNKLRGFNGDERQAIEGVLRGSPTGNLLRFTGNLLGGGGGLGAMTSAAVGGVATAQFGGVGAVAPVVGYAIKSIANRLTLRDAQALQEMVLSRAPLAKAMEDFGSKASAFQNLRGPKTISAVVLSARNLSNNLKDAGITLSPSDIMRSIQGPLSSAADDDQQN